MRLAAVAVRFGESVLALNREPQERLQAVVPTRFPIVLLAEIG
jgi:hypothetical protein